MASLSLLKIVSGGQTGADRAALDAALRHGMPAGGFCPKDRRAEDGRIAEHYPLVETASQKYSVRTCMNIRASDGTLILNMGDLDGGTSLTAEYAAKQNRPFLVVSLDRKSHTPSQVADWIADHAIFTLNVAGPRESKRPGVYRQSRSFLDRLIRSLSARTGRELLNRTTSFLKGSFPPELHSAIFLVGGIVRDILAGKDSRDVDLVAALHKEQLRKFGFRLVEGKSTAPIMFRHDQEFGTIEVTLIPNIDSLADDLASRDFTCNALAMSLEGVLFDPLSGKKDLRLRRLKVCGRESICADPMRIFRAFRFETEGYRMTRYTEKLVRTGHWDDKLQAIPVERFSREMQKALAGREPERFFRRMLEMQAGSNYLPELFRMPLIPAGPAEYHPEGDLFAHSCQVMKQVAVLTGDPLARFCAFFHDLGKLATDPSLHPKHHGHDDAGFVMAQTFCDRMRLPASWKRALAWINRMHGNANRWDELRDSTKIRMAEQSIKNRIDRLLPLVSAADKPSGSRMHGWKKALEVAAMSTEQLGIPQLQIAMMPAETRSAFVLQKRVEAFRKRT